MKKQQAEALSIQISHEKEMLKNWKAGDISCFPVPATDWSIKEQEAYIQGMKNALYIINNYQHFI